SKAVIEAQKQLNDALSQGNQQAQAFAKVLETQLDGAKRLSKQTKDRVKTLNTMVQTEKSSMHLNDKIAKLKSRAKEVDEKALNVEIKRLKVQKAGTDEVQAQAEALMKGLEKSTNYLKKIPGGSLFVTAMGLGPQNLAKLQDNLAEVISGGRKFKDVTKQLPKNFGKTVIVVGILGAAVGVVLGTIKLIGKALKFASTQIDKAGETFGVMGARGGQFTDELLRANVAAIGIGKNMDDVNTVTDSLMKNFGIGAIQAARISAKVLDTGVALGISTSEAADLFGSFMSIGGLSLEQAENLAESTYQLAQQNNVNPSAVMRDIANSSEMIAKFGAQNLDSITKSAVQAKKMGLNLASVEKIADSLLNFQSSLNAEVEASLMIGKQLNFQKARELALSGDMSGMMDNITEQLGGQVAFGRLDVLQKQSLARSLGVSVAEMEKLATNQADVKDEAKSFNDMLGEEGLSTLTSLVNKVKSLGVVFVEKVGPEIEKIVVSIQDWLNTGGMDSLVEGAKSLANTMISIVQNMDMVLGVLGGLAGAAIGFMIGGPVGALIGAAVGGIGGAFAGSAMTPSTGGGSTSTTAEISTGVQDFRTSGGSHLVIRPNGQILRTHPNDTIFGTTAVNDFASGPAASMGNNEAIVNELRLLREQTDTLIRETRDANISGMIA
ncbi:MAG TPA: hypothetical protein DCM40_34005, partial [Maribacter sp.]|nr:hypothetical protein [Maribacter sp.]